MPRLIFSIYLPFNKVTRDW